MDDAATELALRGRDRAPGLSRRILLSETVIGGAVIAAAVAIALLADDDTGLGTGPAIAVTLCFALGMRLPISLGTFYTSPVQLAFVPMLFVCPTPLVPLLVLAGWLAGRIPDVVSGREPPDRLLLVPADCLFALGPVLVLIAFGTESPDWGDWPVYLLALAVQIVTDVAGSAVREWVGFGTAPELSLRATGPAQLIDALLSPLGLLAAFASLSMDYAFLLLLPPAAMLIVYARERSGRLEAALALADAAVARERLVAGASHELVTPIAVMVGLTDRLTSGRELPPERRAQLDGVLRQQTLQLRQLVRQFVDYTRIKADRELDRMTGTADVATVAATLGDVTGFAVVAVDPDRLHQMLTSLVEAATRATGGRAAIAALAGADGVTITVFGPAPPAENPFAEGEIGLYVTAELARRMGGAVALDPQVGGGSAFRLTLPSG